MKRSFYLPRLSTNQANLLARRLHGRFMFMRPMSIFEWDIIQKTLSYTLAPMGRNLYPDESCEAFPHRLGRAVSLDSIREEQVSCFVNGFYEGLMS